MSGSVGCHKEDDRGRGLLSKVISRIERERQEYKTRSDNDSNVVSNRLLIEQQSWHSFGIAWMNASWLPRKVHLIRLLEVHAVCQLYLHLYSNNSCSGRTTTTLRADIRRFCFRLPYIVYAGRTVDKIKELEILHWHLESLATSREAPGRPATLPTRWSMEKISQLSQRL